MGTDGRVGIYLATKKVQCINSFHTELISKPSVGEARSKVLRIDLQVLNQLIRKKEVRLSFEYMFIAVKSTKPTNWIVDKKHIYSEVRWELVNKLKDLTTLHFKPVTSFENVTTTVAAFQHTYNTFITTNKTALLHHSALDKLTKAVADTPAKLNLVNKYIRKNRTGRRGDKALKRFWSKFNERTKKENPSKNDIQVIYHMVEELFRSKKRQALNVENNSLFLHKIRMFG